MVSISYSQFLIEIKAGALFQSIFKTAYHVLEKKMVMINLY